MIHGLVVGDRGTRTRASSTPRAGAGGTGLGLAIVKEIIERHNGTVVAESANPTGARLVITLPAD